MSKNSGSGLQISKPSYLYAIISTTLVLFMLGILGMLLLHAQALSKYFKENIEITVMLDDKTAKSNVNALQKALQKKPYVKRSHYVSLAEATQHFKAENKEDFTEILDVNPLFSSLNLYLYANYANKDSLAQIKRDLLKVPMVKEVFYQENLVDLINSNTSKIGLPLFILSLLFLLMAFTLIDSTIKLAMYANRFLIKSMQLVGATRWFISKPFITQSVYNGILSGLLAAVMLVAVLLLAQKSIPELSLLHNPLKFTLLCVGIISLGIFISWWSTRLSVVKYLQKQLDELY